MLNFKHILTMNCIQPGLSGARFANLIWNKFGDLQNVGNGGRIKLPKIMNIGFIDVHQYDVVFKVLFLLQEKQY
jgi:hypothetical protein